MTQSFWSCIAEAISPCQVDGFRFDIMGHMLVRTMHRIQESLRRLTLEKDGVDGGSMYLYGEAWDFGEMACNQRGRNACQLNIHGLGIGAFNDRFRCCGSHIGEGNENRWDGAGVCGAGVLGQAAQRSRGIDKFLVSSIYPKVI